MKILSKLIIFILFFFFNIHTYSQINLLEFNGFVVDYVINTIDDTIKYECTIIDTLSQYLPTEDCKYDMEKTFEYESGKRRTEQRSEKGLCINNKRNGVWKITSINNVRLKYYYQGYEIIFGDITDSIYFTKKQDTAYCKFKYYRTNGECIDLLLKYFLSNGDVFVLCTFLGEELFKIEVKYLEDEVRIQLYGGMYDRKLKVMLNENESNSPKKQ